MVIPDLTQENNKEMRYYSYSSSFREHFRVKQKINHIVHTFNLNSKHLVVFSHNDACTLINDWRAILSNFLCIIFYECANFLLLCCEIKWSLWNFAITWICRYSLFCCRIKQSLQNLAIFSHVPQIAHKCPLDNIQWNYHNPRNNLKNFKASLLLFVKLSFW